MKNLNEVVEARIQQKIQKGSAYAGKAIQTMIEEGKIATDLFAPIGNLSKGSELTKVTNFDANGTVKMNIQEKGSFTMHDNATIQVSEKLGIPTKYMRDLIAGDGWQKGLAAEILNRHSEHTERSRFLIRAIGNEIRGVLSDRYRPLNSVPILTAFMQQVQANGAVFVDGHYNGIKMWLEVIKPEPVVIKTDNNGMVHLAIGGRISTSDFGGSSLSINMFAMQGVCLNGMVRERLMREVHLGNKLPEDFQFSQRSLQDYTDCQRRFQLRYLEQLAWPAVESEPLSDHERQMQAGAAFHRLVQRFLVGIPDLAHDLMLT